MCFCAEVSIENVYSTFVAMTAIRLELALVVHCINEREMRPRRRGGKHAYEK